MNYIIFDVETSNIFSEVGSSDPRDLDISVVSVYEKKSDKVKTFEQSEFKDMWPIFERADAIIGYNSEHFDIPLLQKYYSGDLTKMKSIDLMKSIKNSFGRRPKLDNVAECTLGRNKISHGIEATEWWKQGKKDLVKKYCEEDVLITKEIFEYILKNKSVKLKDMNSNKVVDVSIDTTGWSGDDADNKAKFTKSLF